MIKKTLQISILITAILLLLTPIKVSATPGQWSASGSIIYYTDGKVVVGATDEWASRLGVDHVAGIDSTITSTNSTVFDFTGDGNTSVNTNNTYKTMVLGNNYRSSDNAGSSTNIGLDVWTTGGDLNYAALFNGGEVGIGTWAPLNKFHVVGTGTGTWASRFDNTNVEVKLASHQGEGLYVRNGSSLLKLKNT